MGKDSGQIGRFECDCLSLAALLYWSYVLVGAGMDIEARELAKWNFNL